MHAWHDRETTAAAKSVFRRSFLDDEKAEIVGIRDSVSLDDLIRRFMRRTGFERYSLLVIDDDFSSDSSSVTLGGLHNTPGNYVDEWANLESARRDPVMQQAKHTIAPLVYDKETYVLAGAGEKWEMQAPFGFASGVCSTFHLPGRLHVFFGLDTSGSLPASRSDLAALVADCHFFGTFVQCAALNVLGGDGECTPHPARLS